jgi:hypothetical protein
MRNFSGHRRTGETSHATTWQPERAVLLHLRLTLIALLFAGALGAIMLIAAAYGATRLARVHAARVLDATDTAHLRYIRSSGALLLEEGSATGALPGTVKVQMNVGATVIASFTIKTRNGSLAGRGSGTLHGTGVYASFGGTMTVSHGTGRYAHAHGHGGFYGVLNRNSYALTVQTTGTLSY